MARYSSRDGRWHGRSRSNVTVPEGTRDEREWHTEMPGGLTRIDFGAPIPRHPSETQPIRKDKPKPVPVEAPVETPKATPISVPPVSRKDHRDHRAITREP